MPIQNGLPSIIKSVQQGFIIANSTGTFTTTISPVNLNKSVLVITSGLISTASVNMTNSTTVTAVISGGGMTANIYFSVTEYA